MERRDLALDMRSEKKGEPLERKPHNGKLGGRKARVPWNKGHSPTRETFPTETEAVHEGEAGAEVSILRIV